MKALPDVIDARLPPDSFVTAESLAEEYKVPREAVLHILNKSSVWPIAKVLNRGAPTIGCPDGTPKGGPPKMAFEPQEARRSIERGIDDMYG